MVHPPEESGPYFLGFFNSWGFGQHCPYEHHGSLAVPAAFPGASQLLREEDYKAPACFSLWRVIELLCEVADSAPSGLPQGVVGDASCQVGSIVAVDMVSVDRPHFVVTLCEPVSLEVCPRLCRDLWRALHRF